MQQDEGILSIQTRAVPGPAGSDSGAKPEAAGLLAARNPSILISLLKIALLAKRAREREGRSDRVIL